MKKHFIWVFVGCMVFGAMTGGAQEPKMGMGLVFTQSIWGTLSELLGTIFPIGDEEEITSIIPPSVIYVPIIDSRENLRLEPEFGLTRSSMTEEIEDVGESSEKTTSLRIGCGLFWYKPVNKVSFYYGGRIGIVRMSSSAEQDYKNPFLGEDSETKTSQTNLYLGPAIGAEYWISEHFSVGGEAQLLYTKYGEPKVETDGEEQEEREVKLSRSLMQTQYMFILRWYF